MYEFRPATERVRRIREQIRNRTIQVDSERALIATEAHKQYEHVIPIIKRPLIAKALCEQMTVRVEDDELFVGNRAKHFLGAGFQAEWGGESFVPHLIEAGVWTMGEDGFYHNPPSDGVSLIISPEDYEQLRSIAEYWDDHKITVMPDAWQPDGYDRFSRLGVATFAPGFPLAGSAVGHMTPGYPKILQTGYGAIAAEAQEWIDAHEGDIMGDDMERYLFYKSAVLACEAVETLTKRYAKACADKAAACTDEKRRAELEMMAEGLEWIATEPARTFWEACQMVLIYKLFLFVESNYPALSFGRFDQYTWPYLKRDLENDVLTEDEAQELVDSFFLKANCYYGVDVPPEMMMTTGVGNTYQHTTIGGVDPLTGMDATNPVTYMVLECMAHLKLHDPTISLRINRGTPDRIWECAMATTREVGGLPLFQNDEVIIPGLVRELGFELRDARDYSVIGCQEIVGSGNDYPAPNGMHPPYASPHMSVIMDMALNNGVNPMNGADSGIKTGYLYEMESIEEVRAAIARMAEYVIKWMVTMNNYTEHITCHTGLHAGLSISMEGCMESGRDCVQGGCKYNSFGGTATGLATIADSLTTIKYLCFDEKLCTTRDIYDAFMANWEGYDELRALALAKVPHYGNADPYADQEMKWVCDLYYNICQECWSKRAGVYKSGLYGASDHVAQGYTTWATPDGRLTGTPIADATSPVQSRDVNGPTAVLESSLCFDHSHFMDGIALNMRIHPTAMSTEDGAGKLVDMVRSYFDRGGLEVQFNVVGVDQMRAAQDDPETNRDLVVRIAGYSAYFVELTKDCQEDIISRTENSL